jgi:Fe-S cluster assembly protein SufD
VADPLPDTPLAAPAAEAPRFVVADLPGPGWLRARRADGLARAGHLPLPTDEAEEWRYSRIAELDLDRYGPAPSEPVEPGSVDVPAAVGDVLAELGPLSGTVVLVDGRVAHAEVEGAPWDAGVRFGSSHDDAIEAEAVLGDAADHPVDLFAAWNDALSYEPVVLDVPAGVTVEHPFVVVSFVETDGIATFPRLSARIGADAEVSLVEIHLSADVASMVAPVTDLALAPAARLHHAVLQDLGQQVWSLGSLLATVERDASFELGVAALGGDYARLRLDCRLQGRGATGNLSSVYLGEGRQMLDLRTFQSHEAPDTTSNLLFKGGVADTSHSVYTGLIRITPEGRGSNAFQTNRNLKLSDGAWAESVPNLEIENNDVHCSHASTVGPVDPDQRFYLESRGVPTSVADRLIVGGFFDEVLGDFAVPALVPTITERMDRTLDRALGRTVAS